MTESERMDVEVQRIKKRMLEINYQKTFERQRHQVDGLQGIGKGKSAR